MFPNKKFKNEFNSTFFPLKTPILTRLELLRSRCVHIRCTHTSARVYDHIVGVLHRLRVRISRVCARAENDTLARKLTVQRPCRRSVNRMRAQDPLSVYTRRVFYCYCYYLWSSRALCTYLCVHCMYKGPEIAVFVQKAFTGRGYIYNAYCIIDAEARHDYYYYTQRRRRQRKEPRPCQLHAIRVVVVLFAAAAADERNLNWETTAAMPSGGSGIPSADPRNQSSWVHPRRPKKPNRPAKFKRIIRSGLPSASPLGGPPHTPSRPKR